MLPFDIPPGKPVRRPVFAPLLEEVPPEKPKEEKNEIVRLPAKKEVPAKKDSPAKKTSLAKRKKENTQLDIPEKVRKPGTLPSILVAEDEQLLLNAISFSLKRAGFDVTTAFDGRDALKKIEEGDYDLLITDIMMPYVNGFEVIDGFKRKFKKMPVIVLSAAGTENNILEAFKLGADDFITKPFSPIELSVRVKRLLHQN